MVVTRSIFIPVLVILHLLVLPSTGDDYQLEPCQAYTNVGAVITNVNPGKPIDFVNPQEIVLQWHQSKAKGDGQCLADQLLVSLGQSKFITQSKKVEGSGWTASLSANLKPASEYQAELAMTGPVTITTKVLSIASKTPREPATSNAFWTPPMRPEIAQVTPLDRDQTNSIKIRIAENDNVEKKKLKYKVSVTKNSSPTQTFETDRMPAADSIIEVNMTIGAGKLYFGACIYDVNLVSYYCPTTENDADCYISSTSSSYKFTGLPKPATKVFADVTGAASFQNPHAITVNWVDQFNCYSDKVFDYAIVFVPNIVSIPKYIIPSTDLTIENPDPTTFSTKLEVALTPATTYSVDVQVSPLSGTPVSSSLTTRVAPKTFSTMPVSPEIEEVKQINGDSEKTTIQIKVSDAANVDRQYIAYEITVCKSNDSSQQFGKTTIEPGQTSTKLPSKLAQSGACSFKVTAVSVYRTAIPSPLTSTEYKSYQIITRPKSVKEVKANLRPELQNRVHVVDIRWMDEENCYKDEDMKNLITYTAVLTTKFGGQEHVERHLLKDIVTNPKNFEMKASLNVILRPAVTYSIGIQVDALSSEPAGVTYSAETLRIDEDNISTPPVPPRIASVVQVEGKSASYDIELFDDENVDKAGLTYDLIFYRDGSEMYTESNIAGSTTKKKVELPIGDKIGACRYSVRANSSYKGQQSMGMSHPVEFTSKPATVSDVTISRPTDMAKITDVTWTDTANCYDRSRPEVGYVAVLAQIDGNGEENILLDKVKADSEAFFYAPLGIDLLHAASYSFTVKVVSLSNGQSSAVSMPVYYFSTLPLKPEITKAEQLENGNIQVDLLDLVNFHKANASYCLTFCDGKATKLDEVTVPAIPANPSWKGKLNDAPRSGACRYTVSATTVYHGTSKYSSKATDPKLFTTKPKEVKDVTFAVQDLNRIELEWTDIENCHDDPEMAKDYLTYAAILTELYDATTPLKKQTQIILDYQYKYPANKNRLTASLDVDLTPASGYSIAVQAIVGKYATREVSAMQIAFTKPVPPVLSLDTQQNETESEFFLQINDVQNQQESSTDFIELSYPIYRNGDKQPNPIKKPGQVSITKFADSKGACRYQLSAKTSMTPSSTTSLSSTQLIFDTSPMPAGPVSSTRFDDYDKPSMLTVTFVDSNNCQPDPTENPTFFYELSLFEFNNGKQSPAPLTTVELHDISDNLVENNTVTYDLNVTKLALRPACKYLVKVVAVSKSSLLEGSRKIAFNEKNTKITSAINPEPPASVELKLKENVNKGEPLGFIIGIPSEPKNCLSDEIYYNVTLQRLIDNSSDWEDVNNAHLMPLLPDDAETKTGPFIQFNLAKNEKLTGACFYKAVATSELSPTNEPLDEDGLATLFRSTSSLQPTESRVVTTPPAPVESIKVALSEKRVTVDLVDPANCRQPFDGPNTYEPLWYEVILTSTSNYGATPDNVKYTKDLKIGFVLTHDLPPSTTYQVSVRVVSASPGSTFKPSSEVAVMFTTPPLSSNLKMLLVDENPTSIYFTLGIDDMYNTKFYTCEKLNADVCPNSLTFNSLNYFVGAKSYDSKEKVCDNIMKDQTTAHRPYVTLNKTKVGCYYSVYAKASLSGNNLEDVCYDENNLQKSITLMTEPMLVELVSGNFTEDETLDLIWRDKANCINVGQMDDNMKYSITVQQLHHYDYLNPIDDTSIARRYVTGEEEAANVCRGVNFEKERLANATVDVKNAAAGCSFEATINVRLREKPCGHKPCPTDNYHDSPLSKPFEFNTKPLPPILHATDNETHVIVKITAHKSMSCYLKTALPSYTIDFKPRSPFEAESNLGQYLLSRDDSSSTYSFTNQVEFKKPKGGACDYDFEATTTSSYGVTSEMSRIFYYLSRPIEPEFAWVSTTSTNKQNVIPLVTNSAAVNYKDVSVNVLWNDKNNCIDNADHISYGVAIFEAETGVNIGGSYSFGKHSGGGDAGSYTQSFDFRNGGLDPEKLKPGCSYRSHVIVRHQSHTPEGQEARSDAIISSNEIVVQPADVTNVTLTRIGETGNVIVSWRDLNNCPPSRRVVYQVSIYRCKDGVSCDKSSIAATKEVRREHPSSNNNRAVPNGVTDYQTSFTLALGDIGIALAPGVGVALLNEDGEIDTNTWSENAQKPNTNSKTYLEYPWKLLFIILTSVLGGLLLISVVFLVAASIYLRKTRQAPSDREMSQTTPLGPTLSLKPQDIGASMKASPSPSISMPYSEMTVSQFVDHVEQAKSNNFVDLHDSYHLLAPIGRDQSTSDGSRREARPKNRYNDIVAYDHSRVRLVVLQQQEDGSDVSQPAADYINASHIRSAKIRPPRTSPIDTATAQEESDATRLTPCYIATQGPKQNTIGDFWLMCLQQHVDIIVMLTTCVEGGRIKCEQYWPLQPGQKVDYGHLHVENVTKEGEVVCENNDNDEDVAAIATPDIVRRTLLRLTDDNSNEMTITHYQHLDWPDRGVPDTQQIIGLLKVVARHREMLSTKKRDRSAGIVHPVVVHCSAGVGRSGVFIALDMALHPWLLANSNIDRCLLPHHAPDLFNTVAHLRRARPNMVQTEDQYNFLYEVTAQVLSKFVDISNKKKSPAPPSKKAKVTCDSPQADSPPLPPPVPRNKPPLPPKKNVQAKNAQAPLPPPPESIPLKRTVAPAGPSESEPAEGTTDF